MVTSPGRWSALQAPTHFACITVVPSDLPMIGGSNFEWTSTLYAVLKSPVITVLDDVFIVPKSQDASNERRAADCLTLLRLHLFSRSICWPIWRNRSSRAWSTHCDMVTGGGALPEGAAAR